MRPFDISILNVATLAALLCSQPAHADTNITLGDCSPIINIHSIDNESLQKSVKEKYPNADLDSIEVVLKIVGCGQELKDAIKRRQILFFALDKMLKIKRTQYLPALDEYLKNPSAESFADMARVGKRNVRQIEDAIDKLLDYQVTVDTTADHAAIPKKVVAGSDEKLRNFERQLVERLGSRLNAKLRSPQDLVDRLRSNYGSPPNESDFREAMARYRDKYVSIVVSIEEIVSEMKAEASKSAN